MIDSYACILLIEECFKKSNILPPKNLNISNMSLSEVDECLDCVANILCNEGFEKNSDPNAYGLELEDAIDYLLNIRYSKEEK